MLTAYKFMFFKNLLVVKRFMRLKNVYLMSKD